LYQLGNVQNLEEKYWVGESGNAIEVVACKNCTRLYEARMARQLVCVKFRERQEAILGRNKNGKLLSYTAQNEDSGSVCIDCGR
jgi:hypothetical protein